MKFLNYSFFITLLTVLSICFSKTLFGDFLGTPATDYLILALGVIVALVFSLASSRIAINHETKMDCFWDCSTDVLSILIHLSSCFFWFYNSQNWLPKNFISLQEFYLIFVLLVIMTIIAIFEFLFTLDNCLEIMRLRGNVKIEEWK